MSRTARDRFSRALSSVFALAGFLLCAGCHNTCISGVLNSPGSTINISISDPPPSCPLSAAKAAVHVEISAVPASLPQTHLDQPTASPFLTHLYVTLSGIEAHPSVAADKHSPDWQQLTPGLQAHPFQVDLLSTAQGAPSPFSETQLQEGIVSAGVYRQVRLRFSTHSASSESGAEAEEPTVLTNHCGTSVLHCAVTSGGRIYPLALAQASQDLPVSLENTEGQQLYIPPDDVVTLLIEFDKNGSLLWSEGGALRLAPVFRLIIKHSSAGAAN